MLFTRTLARTVAVLAVAASTALAAKAPLVPDPASLPPIQTGEAGESCFTLNSPNVNGTACTWKVPQTMALAKSYANSFVDINASRAHLTNDDNKAKACVIQVMRSPTTPGFQGPSHLGLMRYG